jgi:predicted DNA-binding transcriptional regulator YafY
VRSLFAGIPGSLLADLKLDRASDAAHVKLLAALPEGARADAEYARRRVHVDVAGWGSAGETLPHLQTIQEAVWRGRKLYFTYGDGRAAEVERAADPLGLVAKGGVWYLVARAGEEVRSYRVSRFASARVGSEPCGRPEGFDLAAYWAESVARFKSHTPRFEATFRAHESVLHLVHYAGRFSRVEAAGEPDADGWALVRVRFQFEEDACAFALGFGTKAEVVEPASLRERVLEAAREVVDFYSAAEARGG